MKRFMPILKGIAIILLLVAVAGHPGRDFYALLRWLIFLIAAGSTVWAWRHQQPVWIGMFAIIAVVFNPLIPFYLPHATWALMDVATAAVFAVSLFSDYFPQRNKSN